MDDVEAMAVIKPAYLISFAYDENINENNTFILLGRSYVIRKITPVFFMDDVIYKVAVCY